MSKVVANLGSAFAVLLAILWTVLCFVPWVWVSSSSNVISFKANLLCLWTTPGIATGLATGLSGLVGLGSLHAKLDTLTNRSLWLEMATTEYCESGYEMLFGWCDNWMMVKYSSWGMIFFGMAAATMLVVGACFMMYYVNFHATQTGRTWIKVSFITAPLCAIAGLSQYIALTLEFGQMRNVGPVTSIYGTGFIFACVLTLLSWVPLCIHALFSRKARGEKAHGKDDISGSDEEGAGMGHGNMGGGYNTFGGGQDSYGAYCPPPQAGGQLPGGPMGGPGMPPLA